MRSAESDEFCATFWSIPVERLLQQLGASSEGLSHAAADSVDAEMISKPRRWDIRFIRNFMLTFGTLSSLFDYLTFGVLMLVLHATTEQFRTGWFVESVVSATTIVLVIRTRRPFFQTRPAQWLLLATAVIVACTLVLPFTPLAALFDFTPLPFPFLFALGMIVIFYVYLAEVLKRIFYRNTHSSNLPSPAEKTAT